MSLKYEPSLEPLLITVKQLFIHPPDGYVSWRHRGQLTCIDPSVSQIICLWKREFKPPWREAGPPNHHDDKVDSDQYVVNKELSPSLSLSLDRTWWEEGEAEATLEATQGQIPQMPPDSGGICMRVDLRNH